MRYQSRFFRLVVLILLWLVVAQHVWQFGKFGQPAQAAGEFSYAIALNYRLEADGQTTVTSTYRVTNNTGNKILASLQINAPASTTTDLKVTYADGSPIRNTVTERTNATLGYSYKYKEINLTFDNWPGGRGTGQSFTVQYRTPDLMDLKGASKTFYVPSLAQVADDEAYTVSVSVPRSFGKLISTSSLPQINGSDGDRVRYTFARAADLRQSVALIFGDTTIYKVDFAYPLKNDSGRERTMTVALPPNTSSQKIFLNRLDPAPVRTRLDADGNILADYQVAAGQSLTVRTDISAQVKYLEYDLAKGGTKDQIPASLVQQYTGATRYWQTNDASLRTKASQVVGKETKVVEMIRSLQKYTVDTLTYNNEKIKYNIRQGSSKALRDPNNAVCLEYSDLMIALLRSQGIPARMPVGYAYTGNLKQSRAVTDSLHSWVEAYVPGIGWINLDPTWAEKFDTFGKSDLDHFTFALWGRDDALPAPVMLDGQDVNYQYEQTTISYDVSVPPAESTGQAAAATYVLFPGFSVVQYKLTAPGNVAGDLYAALLKNETDAQQRFEVGSLAPLQVVEKTKFQWSGAFGSAAQLVFVQKTVAGDSVIAAATGQVIWWPMYVSLGLVAGICGYFLLKFRLRKQTKPEISVAVTTAAMEAALTAAHQKDVLAAEASYSKPKLTPHDHKDDTPLTH